LTRAEHRGCRPRALHEGLSTEQVFAYWTAPYEINAAWQSGEITPFNNEVVVPGGKLIPGRTYRVRVRMKDANGRWSHWSAPVQFVAGQPDTSINALRVTELMYHPADPPIGSTYNSDVLTTLALQDASGRTLWEGSAPGDATRYGRARSEENINELMAKIAARETTIGTS